MWEAPEHARIWGGVVVDLKAFQRLEDVKGGNMAPRGCVVVMVARV